VTYDLQDFSYLTRIHYYAKSDEIWAEHESEYLALLRSLQKRLLTLIVFLSRLHPLPHSFTRIHHQSQRSLSNEMVIERRIDRIL